MAQAFGLCLSYQTDIPLFVLERGEQLIADTEAVTDEDTVLCLLNQPVRTGVYRISCEDIVVGGGKVSECGS